MAVVFLEVSDPLTRKADGAGENLQARANRRGKNNSDVSDPGEVETPEQRTARIDASIQDFVNEFFDRLDKNNDGVLMRSEAPIALRTRFWQYDHNNDQAADRTELEAVARRKFDPDFVAGK
jgi:hypothetical protein